MYNNIFIFILALFLLVKGATLATKYAGRLAESFHLSKYTVGFIIVAVISILPETFISINAALAGIPSFGLGMLFGSNIADLTLIFALIVLLSGRNLKVESKILKNQGFFPFILLLPLVLGFNGHFSRLEGLVLVIVGIVFYVIALKNGNVAVSSIKAGNRRFKDFCLLVFSMAVLLVGAHFIVSSATFLAQYFGISPILIGMFIVALGTTMPEFLFSLKSVKIKDDSLAIGDMLGTVLADATIVVGIIALINPFFFPQKLIYLTGVLMVLASFILFRFMRTGRVLTKKEAWFLILAWAVFILTEFMVNR